MKSILNIFTKISVLAVFSVFFVCSISAQSNDGNKKTQTRKFGWSLEKKSDIKSKRNETKKEQKDDSDEDTIRIETNLVANDILVLNEKGFSVKGLKKEDFVIYEDGKPQQIETLALGDNVEVPRSIVLIIDYSGSQFPYIETSIESAKVLVDKLRPNDRMAIVTDDVELLTNFTTDKKLLKENLQFLKNTALSKKVGQSLQFSALYAVLNEVFTRDDDVRPIVIFQTDGDELGRLKENSFHIPNNNRYSSLPGFDSSERNFSLSDILAATDKVRATVYTIFPGIRLIGLSEKEQFERARKDYENRLNANPEMKNYQPNSIIDKAAIIKSLAGGSIKRQTVLAGIAKYSGGWADFLEMPEQASEVYTRILSGIESRYIIGYYPTNEAKNGKRRVVKIEVKNHPEYIIWGRKTYFAPEPKN